MAVLQCTGELARHVWIFRKNCRHGVHRRRVPHWVILTVDIEIMKRAPLYSQHYCIHICLCSTCKNPTNFPSVLQANNVKVPFIYLHDVGNPWSKDYNCNSKWDKGWHMHNEIALSNTPHLQIYCCHISLIEVQYSSGCRSMNTTCYY